PRRAAPRGYTPVLSSLFLLPEQQPADRRRKFPPQRLTPRQRGAAGIGNLIGLFRRAAALAGTPARLQQPVVLQPVENGVERALPQRKDAPAAPGQLGQQLIAVARPLSQQPQHDQLERALFQLPLNPVLHHPTSFVLLNIFYCKVMLV